MFRFFRRSEPPLPTPPTSDSPERRPKPATAEAIAVMQSRSAAVDAAAVAAEEPEAFRAWQAGTLRPWRLTALLDEAGAEGGWVDEACGTAEPDVILWEEGSRYPTWDNTVRVAALTGTPVVELLRDDNVGAPVIFARCFDAIVSRERRERFLPALIALTVDAHPNRPTDDLVHGVLSTDSQTRLRSLLSGTPAGARVGLS